MDYKCGYNIEDENRERLLAGAQPASQYSFGTIDPTQLGKPMGLIDVLKVEDQLRLSSCAGNSYTTVAETCLWHQSSGSIKVQLSRMFAYVEGQKQNGIVGDNGAVLEGVIKAGQELGTPQESFAQYTGDYYRNFSDAAYANAKNQKLASYSTIKTVQDVYEGLARRVGAVYFGIPCTQEIFNSPPDGKLDYYYPQRCGGHALCIVDWCEEKDENGHPYLLSPGSWSERYGYRGYRKIKPSAFKSMLDCSLTSAFLLSDMAFQKPRYNWESQSWLA